MNDSTKFFLVIAACGGLILGGVILSMRFDGRPAVPVESPDAGVLTTTPDGGHGPVDFIAGAKEGQVGRLEADDSCFIIHRRAGGPMVFAGGSPDEITLHRERYRKDSAECLLMRAAMDSLQTLSARLERCSSEKMDLYKQCIVEIEKARKK